MEIPGLRNRPFFEDKTRAFWILQALGWSFYLMLRVASGVGSGVSTTFIVPLLVTTATGYSITLIMGGVFRWLINRKPVVTWSLSVVCFAMAVTFHSIVDAWVFNLLDREGAGFSGALFLSALSMNALLLGAWSALYYSINFYIIIEKQNDQMVKLESQATQAQLAMLRYQLNPHFLFNTLNSISTLVLLKQTSRANAMLSRLSSFLRYTLANEATAHVTLEQEVETLKLYLDIEKMRFENRLRPEFFFDQGVMRARLPSLLLQPLVENAIKYAVSPLEEGSEIAISARLQGDRVIITVSDSGPGHVENTTGSAKETGTSGETGIKGETGEARSTGVGLANIRDRLSQAYGEDHRFETEARVGEGFRVLIDIPFQTETPMLEAA
jgi:LytS/YehU family sensor histidine kinase